METKQKEVVNMETKQKEEKIIKIQSAVSVSIKGICKIDNKNTDSENKEENAAKVKGDATIKLIHKIKNESGVKQEMQKEDDSDKGNRKSISFAEKCEEENIPTIKISDTVTEKKFVDETVFEVDTEVETDSENDQIPLLQIKAVKAEDCMVEYRSQTSSTDEFNDENSQESYDRDEVIMAVIVDEDGDENNDDDDDNDCNGDIQVEEGKINGDV